jgi:hypothetical protein
VADQERGSVPTLRFTELGADRSRRELLGGSSNRMLASNRLMRVLKASVLYYIGVFAVGFVLGTIRVLLVVPMLGVRWAEILEQPLMLAASFFFARLAVLRQGPFSASRRLVMGLFALALMLGTEIALTLVVQGRTLVQYLTGRDLVSGIAYLLSLAAFALMPLFAGGQARQR